jgi:ferritin-like metal-binding protein YciE
MEMKALEDLFLREIAEMNNAERQILKALPKLAKAAAHRELRAAFETHLKQTERHVERIEKIFKALGREPESVDSDPVSEIVKQGEQFLSLKHPETAVLDAALIATAQKVEHYEIALYGAAHSHATMLGYLKVAALLAETLREEEATDALLSGLATKRVNADAVKAPFAMARVAPRGGEETSNWGLGTLLTGAAIGAVVAILYAPKAGVKTRRDLQHTADDLRAKGEDLIERGRNTINEQRSRFSRVL